MQQDGAAEEKKTGGTGGAAPGEAGKFYPRGGGDTILLVIEAMLLQIIPLVAKFPRDHKFLLGDRLYSKLLDVQECCLRAYYSKDKRAHLIEANLLLENSRHLVRLSYKMRCLNLRGYEQCSRRIDELGRMVGGWLRSLAGKEVRP